MKEYEKYTTEYLEKALDILRRNIYSFPQHQEVLNNVQKEIQDRLVPKGELHLTVLKGEKKPFEIDFGMDII